MTAVIKKMKLSGAQASRAHSYISKLNDHYSTLSATEKKAFRNRTAELLVEWGMSIPNAAKQKDPDMNHTMRLLASAKAATE